jgi:small subunit ribosomal protein S17
MSDQDTNVQATEAQETPVAHHQKRRTEKIGVIISAKTEKTVIVRVDRLVKHPIYKRYVRRRAKFMAHNELECKLGDKVRIEETRPLSARKRWRVVEVVHRAA